MKEMLYERKFWTKIMVEMMMHKSEAAHTDTSTFKLV